MTDSASADAGTSAHTPAPVANLPNALTILRLALVPVFGWLVIASDMEHPDWRMAACAAFLFASFTDFIDGWLARARNLVTSFGKVADPIADKALTGAALVLLSAYQAVPWWVTTVILVREIGITLLRFWVIRHGVIAASRGGKVKTALQVVAIAWYLWPWPDPIAALSPWIMAATVIVTVGTGVDYVARAIALRRGAAREAAPQ